MENINEKYYLKALDVLMEDNSGIVIEIEDQKILLIKSNGKIEFSKIKKDDDDLLNYLKDGEIVFMED